MTEEQRQAHLLDYLGVLMAHSGQAPDVADRICRTMDALEASFAIDIAKPDFGSVSELTARAQAAGFSTLVAYVGHLERKAR